MEIIDPFCISDLFYFVDGIRTLGPKNKEKVFLYNRVKFISKFFNH